MWVEYKKLLILISLSVFLLILPWFIGNYLTYLFNLSGIYVIAIIGLNILMGLGGQMFFGGVALMALGAYGAASLTNQLHVPFYLSIPLAGFITCFLSLLITIPALRLRGLYLAMVSVGFHLILEQLIGGWDSFTGGYNGLSLPKASLAGIQVASDRAFYYVILVTVILCLWSAINLMKMRVGRAIWSIGQDPVVCSVLGVHVTFYKIVAFMVCAFYCGVSGGLMAHYLRFITPDHFTMILAIMLLVGMIIGGWGSLKGSIAGGFFVTILPEGIQLFKDYFLGAATALYDVQAIISGIIIIVVVIFMPKGFAEWVKDLLSKWSYNRRGRR
ncbi:MAG: branched-chain amino acid ABC transporter permease [Thermodesulfobacteriota bacterium]